MSISPEIEGISIIVLGAFNPQIFNPDWLARQKLIQEGEAEKAAVEAISSDIAVFSLGWAKLEVTRERAAFSTNQPQHYEILRDLVIAVFKILRHTPLTRFGINWIYHFKMPDEESWHKVGHKLTPKEPWKDALEKPGMRNVTMQGARSDDLKGSVNVTVQPSVKVRPGLYINVNDDFELNTEIPENSAEQLVKIISGHFEESHRRSKTISERILQT